MSVETFATDLLTEIERQLDEALTVLTNRCTVEVHNEWVGRKEQLLDFKEQVTLKLADWRRDADPDDDPSPAAEEDPEGSED